MTIDVGRELQGMKAHLARLERSARLSHASIDDTSVQVRDATGNLRGLLGVQADGTTAVNIVNGAAPPQPSDPIVTSVLGGVTVSWDGQFTDDAVLPLDWARVEVHAAIVSPYTPIPATLQGTIETAQGATVVVPCDTDVYVRLVARNTSGTASTPSAIVGPNGPTPVVADDILDGIVTELKLADDAVTQAKIAADAVGSTQIQDDSVTTAKIIAGAILAGQIAAGAVVTDKLAAEAVTAGKIAALAITTDKLAANAVTTAKLTAGSVDATALAADAITGKTITGGTVTGALIQTAASGERVTLNAAGLNKVLVHNSAGLAIAELSSNGLTVKGTNGAILWLDPNNTFPNLRLTNAAGTNSAVVNVSGTNARLGMNSGTFTERGYTDMKWRSFIGEGFGVLEQVRDSDTTKPYGGRLDLRPDKGTFGYVDSDDTTQNALLFMQPQYASIDNARLGVFPPASSNSAVYVNTTSGHTGYLLRLTANGTDKFYVDKDGNVTILGIGQKLFARKTADAPARTSATPSADPHLSVSLTASATFRLEGFLKWSGDSASDINLGWNTPASAAGSWVCYGGDAAMSAVPATMRIIDTAIGSTRSYGVISTVTGQAIRGTVRTTTAGTLSLNWGAQTAGGTGVSLLTDSWIYLERVE